MVTVNIPNHGPQVVTLPAAYRNIMPAKEYELLQAGLSAPKDAHNEKDLPDNKRKAPPGWSLDGMDASRVKTEKNWPKMIADGDNLNQLF